ncbi:MAG TPA: energy transducer TonB [Bryobacteraceae bacterium]|nr:energy transducer TonB [Bryobacteraceae bacterium]
MYLIGDVGPEERQHVEGCTACQAKIASFVASLANFRGAVRDWSDRSLAKDRAAEMHWTVIPAADPLERLLLPASIDGPWYRSLWSNLCDLLRPETAPLDVTSKPVLVRDIWGQYGRQKKSWVLSVALQSAVVVLVAWMGMSKPVQQAARSVINLVLPPDLAAFQPKAAPAREKMGGGGGGGDRSPLPASKGRLPKASLRQFTPPVAVLNNQNAKLTMEPSIIAPPDVNLPQVNMAQYGDPLGRLGPPSNGPGSGGGIGTGKGGGVGSGDGGGYGPGSGGGVGGGAFRVGGGVSAPVLLSKVEPEYSEEARKAKYQGIVVLYVEITPDGRATNIRVQRSLGLGLDEKAIEAVKRWKFKPGMKNGQPVTVAALIEVNFRLL